MKHPKFLLGQNWLTEPDNFYIIHLEQPRFIIKGDMADLVQEHEVLWLDDEPEEGQKNKLLGEAIHYYEEETLILKKGGD